MNTNDFSVAKVGDRVWYIHGGLEGVGGTNAIITLARSGIIQIAPDYNMNDICDFLMDGRRYHRDTVPSLYWSRPQIIAPPRPKRMVKKVVEVRPFKYKGVPRLTDSDFDNSVIGWCGPVQPIEILVEEE